MTRVAPAIPASSDLLCEHCGYTLNGLPADARCPECGNPVTDSVADGRVVSTWESREGGAKVGGFFRTTYDVIVRPTWFFRHLTARRDDPRGAVVFALVHSTVASLLAGVTGAAHFQIISDVSRSTQPEPWLKIFPFAVLSLILLWLTTWFAARLTAWESAYRGYRLPIETVKRCLMFHAAHYLPVTLVTAAFAVGYLTAVYAGRLDYPTTVTTYLYGLSALVIVTAIYLFWTYWIAMRNVMFANR